MRYLHRMNTLHTPGDYLHVEIDVREGTSDTQADLVVAHDPGYKQSGNPVSFYDWWQAFPLAGRVILNIKASHLGSLLNEIVPPGERHRCIILDASAPDAAFYRAHGWTVARRVGLEDDLDPASRIVRNTPDPVFIDWDPAAVMSPKYHDIASLVLSRCRRNLPVIFFDDTLYDPTLRANPFYLTLEQHFSCVSIVVKEHAARRNAPGPYVTERPQAVLLDHDGVLCPSGQLHHDALARAVHEVTGLTAPPEWQDSTLPSRTKLAELTGVSPWDREQIIARKAAFIEMALHDIQFPADRAWIPALLRELDDAKVLLGLVTNTNRNYVVRTASRLGLDLHAFLAVVTNDKFPAIDMRPKPAPDPYRAALSILNVAPEHALVIEDSQDGFDAGVAAGATVQLVRSGCTTDLTTVLAQIWIHSTTPR